MARKLYVGNLPFSAGEAERQELFGTAGTVDSVKGMRDRATGRARGVAFVEMACALARRAARLGCPALAITRHDSQSAGPAATAYARERGITLMPGIERTIGGRHVRLLTFPAAEAESVRTLDDVARLKGRGDGLVIAPHPFFPDRSCLGAALDRHADLFDAIEWSYFWTRGVNFNARAARWARAHGKALVGNS